jgi:hypothetical protein
MPRKLIQYSNRVKAFLPGSFFAWLLSEFQFIKFCANETISLDGF